MDTFITNPEPNPKKKRGGKAHKKGGGKKHHRRNPANAGNPRKGKRRGSAYRGARSNPGFGTFVPGAAGGLAFRLGLAKIAGDKFYEPDGKISTMGYVVGAGLLYYGDEVARFLRFQGNDSIAFQGGMAAIAGSIVADKMAPDLSKAHLFQMPQATASALPAVGASGLGATRDRPISRDAYHQLSGLGQLGQFGAVVYVQHADGSVWEYPTVPATGTSGMGQVTIPDGAGPGDVIRNKRTGERYRLEVAGDTLVARPIGMAGGREDYRAAA